MKKYKQRLIKALADHDKGYTERLIDDALEQGDIQKATDLGKQGLKSTTSALATAGLLATGAGAFGALPADIVNTSFGIHGTYNAASKNGIRKTIRLAREHDIPGAIQSGLGDALDLTMGLNTLRLGTRLGKSIISGSSLGNAYRSDVAGRELANNISKTVIPESDITKNILAGKVGWGPSTSNTLWHNSDKPLTELKVDYPAWDVAERNAPLGHVWLSDRETTSGFLAKRPYHLKSKVTLNKPMVQIGEAIGDGKNATRNEILDFAQKSNADALQFKNIADNQLTGQNVSAVFKNINLQPKLSEAEKLGIPKDLQSNPRALEDHYYWGYRQWNQRYNKAVEAGNVEEAQRLRDLHFQTKALNNQLQVDGRPITLYHGNLASDSQLASAGYNPYSTARTAVGSSGYFAVTDPQIASTYKGPSGSIKTVYGYSKNPTVYDAKGRNWQDAFIKEVNGHKFGVKTDAVVNSAFNNGHDSVLIDNVVDYGFYTPASYPRQPFTDYVLKPGHVKLRDAVVEDGLFFEPIPIVKRDNFHNPDIRYKQGGILTIFGHEPTKDWKVKNLKLVKK